MTWVPKSECELLLQAAGWRLCGLETRWAQRESRPCGFLAGDLVPSVSAARRCRGQYLAHIDEVSNAVAHLVDVHAGEILQLLRA